MTAPAGTYDGQPLDAAQTHAVVAALRRKAKLAGGVAALLGTVPQGSERIGVNQPLMVNDG